MVDFFVRNMRQFSLDIFIRVMGLSITGRFVLSAQNESKKVKHTGQDNKTGIASLT